MRRLKRAAAAERGTDPVRDGERRDGGQMACPPSLLIFCRGVGPAAPEQEEKQPGDPAAGKAPARTISGGGRPLVLLLKKERKGPAEAGPFHLRRPVQRSVGSDGQTAGTQQASGGHAKEQLPTAPPFSAGRGVSCPAVRKRERPRQLFGESEVQKGGALRPPDRGRRTGRALKRALPFGVFCANRPGGSRCQAHPCGAGR